MLIPARALFKSNTAEERAELLRVLANGMELHFDRVNFVVVDLDALTVAANY